DCFCLLFILSIRRRHTRSKRDWSSVVCYSDLEMLDYVKDAGLDSVEIGTGGNPGDEFCPLDELLESEDKRKAYLEKVHERGLTISAFSCHNNHIAPNPKEAQETHETFVKT